MVHGLKDTLCNLIKLIETSNQNQADILQAIQTNTTQVSEAIATNTAAINQLATAILNIPQLEGLSLTPFCDDDGNVTGYATVIIPDENDKTTTETLYFDTGYNQIATAPAGSPCKGGSGNEKGYLVATCENGVEIIREFLSDGDVFTPGASATADELGLKSCGCSGDDETDTGDGTNTGGIDPADFPKSYTECPFIDLTVANQGAVSDPTIGDGTQWFVQLGQCIPIADDLHDLAQTLSSGVIQLTLTGATTAGVSDVVIQMPANTFKTLQHTTGTPGINIEYIATDPMYDPSFAGVAQFTGATIEII